MPALHNYHSWVMGHGGLRLEEAPSVTLVTTMSSDISLLLRCYARDCPMLPVFGSPVTPHTMS